MRDEVSCPYFGGGNRRKCVSISSDFSRQGLEDVKEGVETGHNTRIS